MIRSYKGVRPTIPASCYVDDSAQIIGDVVLGEHASVWMCAVLRGDVHEGQDVIVGSAGGSGRGAQPQQGAPRLRL